MSLAVALSILLKESFIRGSMIPNNITNRFYKVAFMGTVEPRNVGTFGTRPKCPVYRGVHTSILQNSC